MSGRFAGRRAVITGASRGIGAAVAERLAAEGADVAITARTLDQHDHLAGSLTQTRQRAARCGARVAVIVADLTDEHQRDTIIPTAADELGGPIDILVNNAAAAIYQPIATYPLRRRRVTFEANVHAPLDLIQAVIPGMRAARRGWVVNVSSASASIKAGPPFDLVPPGADQAVYAASKAALNRLTNGLGAELYGTGIRVNTIQPRAGVLTEGAKALVGKTLKPEQVESLEEMVEAVVALCDCPETVTGQIHVSLDLIRDWGLRVHGLDGKTLESAR
ncbi:short chain dehydrogenase [Mycobacterium heckeshornense]|uniref:SDR family NAD(P)-dependent oxidoreductase n=1 Tax=Mycobacterium heckeshornense TaxID=110505 RepID=UPI0019445E56|nr:SDR family oxidoreductase [Mycobacterium heckeshornense]BCQ07827.1 short chain dehydrogenase [Mycobacterium heckeshornense]